MLVALIVTCHVQHGGTECWLAGTEQSFATCPIAALGRIPRHEFWPDSLSFADVVMDGVGGHRQVTAAHPLPRQRLVTRQR